MEDMLVHAADVFEHHQHHQHHHHHHHMPHHYSHQQQEPHQFLNAFETPLGSASTAHHFGSQQTQAQMHQAHQHDQHDQHDQQQQQQQQQHGFDDASFELFGGFDDSFAPLGGFQQGGPEHSDGFLVDPTFEQASAAQQPEQQEDQQEQQQRPAYEESGALGQLETRHHSEPASGLPEAFQFGEFDAAAAAVVAPSRNPYYAIHSTTGLGLSEGESKTALPQRRMTLPPRIGSAADGLAGLSDEQLGAEEKEVEKQAKLAKHKHRKGTVCPRCRVDQRLKQIRRVLHKRSLPQYRRSAPENAKRRRVRRVSEPPAPTTPVSGKQVPCPEPSIQPSSLPYGSSSLFAPGFHHQTGKLPPVRA